MVYPCSHGHPHLTVTARNVCEGAFERLAAQGQSEPEVQRTGPGPDDAYRCVVGHVHRGTLRLADRLGNLDRKYRARPCPELSPPQSAGLSLGDALALLKSGRRVSRTGWNGKGMSIELQRPDGHSKMTLPYIFLRTVSGDLVPWLASQTDLLADDWQEA